MCVCVDSREDLFYVTDLSNTKKKQLKKLNKCPGWLSLGLCSNVQTINWG